LNTVRLFVYFSTTCFVNYVRPSSGINKSTYSENYATNQDRVKCYQLRGSYLSYDDVMTHSNTLHPQKSKIFINF